MVGSALETAYVAMIAVGVVCGAVVMGTATWYMLRALRWRFEGEREVGFECVPDEMMRRLALRVHLQSSWVTKSVTPEEEAYLVTPGLLTCQAGGYWMASAAGRRALRRWRRTGESPRCGNRRTT